MTRTAPFLRRIIRFVRPAGGAANIRAAILVVCLLLLPLVPDSARAAYPPCAGPVLAAAESLFKAMKERNYPRIWSLLTRRSQESILGQVHQALVKHQQTEVSLEWLRADFETGGVYAGAYWGAYLNEFNPDAVLEHSRWSLGAVKKNRAEISILYRKAKQPALVQLYFEDNRWKVGLEETFRTRRWLK